MSISISGFHGMSPFEIHISPTWCREIRTLTRKLTTGFVMKTQSSLPAMLVTDPLWPVVRFHGFHKWICWWCWFGNCNIHVNSMIPLSLLSQTAPKRSQRSSRWSKTAFIHSRVLVISWRTNAISDWDRDGSFSTKSWRCNIWSESLVKYPTDIISPDEQIWFLINKSLSDEHVEFPTKGIPSCKAEFPTKGNSTDAFAGTNPT